MGGMRCCFISAAGSASEVRVLASNAVSHRQVTMEASEPAERDRSGNWKMLTVSFIQSGFSVWKWSHIRRTAIVWVTRGTLDLRSRALFLHDISKAGLAFSFVSGEKSFRSWAGLQDPVCRRVCTGKEPVSPTVLPDLFSWRALPGPLVGCG